MSANTFARSNAYIGFERILNLPELLMKMQIFRGREADLRCTI
jgi:hypothetical protein